VQLDARPDSELAEHLSKVPLDGTGAQEQLSGDLRIRPTVPSELRDL
jgi:hypothetical protein